MQRIVSVTLNPALDTLITVEGFRAGADFYKQKVVVSAGGKGVNVLRAFRACQTLADLSSQKKILKYFAVNTGFLGGRAGDDIKNILRREKIRFSFEKIEGVTRTNYTILDPLTSRQTRILGLGPNVSKTSIRQFELRFSSLLRRDCWVIFSGRLAQGLPENFYATLIRQAKKYHTRCFLDTSGLPLRHGIKAGPFVVKPNRIETESVLGYRLSSKEKIRNALYDLRELGAKQVLISLDQKGAAGYDGKHLWFVPAPRIKIKSDVGSGDAFNAGFLFSQLNGMPFADSLRLAVAAGTANTVAPAPGLINAQVVRGLFKDIKAELLG